MDLTSTVRIAPHVHYTVTGDTAVVMDLRRGDYLGLDPVGTRIWQLVAGGAPIGAAVEQMLGEYADVPRERVEADVLAFLAQCRGEGLLSVQAA